MAAGKIRKRADIDQGGPRRMLTAKLVERERRERRWFHPIQTRAPLVHGPQPEEVGRVRAQAVEERPDERLLRGRGKELFLVPLFPEGRRPPPARAGRTERAGTLGWVNGQVIRKVAETLMGRPIEIVGQRFGLFRPDQVRPGRTAGQDGSSTEQRQRLWAVKQEIGTYKTVKANKGAAGVDDESITEFGKDLKGTFTSSGTGCPRGATSRRRSGWWKYRSRAGEGSAS